MGILNRNKDGKKRKGMGLGLADNRKSPLQTDEQTSPEPERVTRPDEDAETAIHQLQEPPQAEGDR